MKLEDILNKLSFHPLHQGRRFQPASSLSQLEKKLVVVCLTRICGLAAAAVVLLSVFYRWTAYLYMQRGCTLQTVIVTSTLARRDPSARQHFPGAKHYSSFFYPERGLNLWITGEVGLTEALF